MAKTVQVCCKLPNGLIVEHPLDPSKKVTLKGRNSATIIGATYGVTELDGDFWDAWISMHSKDAAVECGAIFTVGTAKDVPVAAKDYEEVKTGLEPMPREAAGVKAA